MVHSNRLFLSSPTAVDNAIFLPYSGDIPKQFQEAMYKGFVCNPLSQEIGDEMNVFDVISDDEIVEFSDVGKRLLRELFNMSEERANELFADALAEGAPGALKGLVRRGLTGLFNWLEQDDEEDDEEGDDDERENGGFGFWTE